MNILGRLFGSSQTPKQQHGDISTIPRSSLSLRDVDKENQQNFEENAQVAIQPPTGSKKKSKEKTKAQRNHKNVGLENKTESDVAGDNQRTDDRGSNEEGDDDAQTKSNKSKKNRNRKSKIVDEPNEMHEDVAEQEAPAKVKKPRKLKKKKTSAEKSPQEEPEIMDVLAEKVQAPSKISKRKQKKSKVLSEETAPLDEDLTHAGQQIHSEAVNISHKPEIEDEQNDRPVRPSAKALGKRKAPDTLPEVLSKARRPRISKESPGKSLLDHELSGEGSRSYVNVEDLVQTAQELYMQSTMEGVEQGSSPAPEKKGKQKSKAKAPLMLSGGGSIRPTTVTARQSIPQFTPISNKSTNAPAQNAEDSSRNLDNPSQIPQTSSPKSNKHRKRRLPVESQEGEPSNSRQQGAFGGAFGTPAAKKAAPRKSKAPKESKEKGPVRKGKITAEEAKAIDTAVATYREMYDLTQFRMNEIIQSAQGFVEHKDFWNSVREAAPEVPHRKIYETCRRKYHNFEARAIWTTEQDDELKDAYQKFPQKWKQIGELINRFPEDTRDRWRNYLVCGDKQRKDFWDKEEEDRLRQVVAECVAIVSESRRASGDTKVDHQSDEKMIDWGVVSEKMGFVRSRLQCMGKWKQLKEREDSDDERLNAITKTEWRAEEATRAVQQMTGSDILQLLRTIRDSGAGKESKIPWLIVTDALNKLGKRMSLKLCFRKLRSKIPDGKEMRFRDALEHLISVFEKSQPDIPERYKDTEVVRDIKRRPHRYSVVNSSVRVDDSSGDEGPKKIRTRSSYTGEVDMASWCKTKRKRSSKSDDEVIQEEPAEDVDNGDGPSKKKKRKTKRTVEAPVPLESDQEPDFTPAKKKKMKRRVEAPVPTESDQELDFTPAKKKKKKKHSKPDPEQVAAAEKDEEPSQQSKQERKKKKRKLRESMKRQDESQSQSQEPMASQDSGPIIHDIAQTLHSLKKRRKIRKNKGRELDDVLAEEMTGRGESNESIIQEGQQVSQFSDQEQDPEPDGHLEENSEDDEGVELSDDQDLEMNGGKHHPEAELSYEDEEQDTEMHHAEAQLRDNDEEQDAEMNPVEAQLGDDDEEEEEQESQAGGDSDEMEIDPDEGEVYGVPNGLSPHPSSNEEDTTPQLAESVDRGTLTPIKKAPAPPVGDDSTSTSGSSPSDSDSDFDAISKHAQEMDELDHELGQFREAQEVEEDQELEDELKRNFGQDSDEEPEQNGHLEEDIDTPQLSHPRSLSPDLDTPVEYDGRNGHRTSVSPDLDTPVKDDGRKSRRSTKRIIYDDTAHLVSSEGEADTSDEEPRPKADGTRARKVNGTKLNINSIRRRGSVSSSDDSIPAEATPQHLRAERMSQTPPFSYREQSEDTDWAAIRRRQASNGGWNINNGSNRVV